MDASKMDVDDDGGTGAQVPAADSSADDRCPICWNGITHRIKLPCSHEFCFLCAKGAVLRSSTCPMCRGAVPADFFDHCTINSENVNIATFEGTYHWYYEGRNGWWLFDSRVSQEIEEQYQKRRQRLLATATASVDTSAATTSAAIVSSSLPSAAIPTPTISNTSANRPDSTGSDLAGAVNVINLDDTDDTVDTVDTEDTEEEDEEDVEEEEADDYDEDDDDEEEDDLDINFINALAEDEDEDADPEAASPSVDQCEVMIAGFMYMIDFAAMIQYRRDSPSRIRRIKRDQAEANTKGIAGLRGNINFI